MNFRNLRCIAFAAGSLTLAGMLWAQDAQPPAEAPAAAEPAVDPAKVVITMGDQKLTVGDFNAYVNVLPPDTRAVANGSGRRKVAEQLVQLKLLSAKARSQGLDKTPQFQQQLSLMQDNILAGLYLRGMEKMASDDDIKKYYEDNKANFERVTARHILIATGGEKGLTDEQAKAKADEIKKKLDGGGDFAALAKAESADTGSKESGGQLEPFAKGEMIPEFEKVAFEQKPDQISDPVKTMYGYHIIQTQKKEAASLEQVRDGIFQKLSREKFTTMMSQLEKDAAPKYDEGFFGPPSTQPAADASHP